MIGFIAFILVIIAMDGIEKKQVRGQAFMFFAQIFWLINSIMDENLWLGVQSVILGIYTARIWVVWSDKKKLFKWKGDLE